MRQEPLYTFLKILVLVLFSGKDNFRKTILSMKNVSGGILMRNEKIAWTNCRIFGIKKNGGI